MKILKQTQVTICANGFGSDDIYVGSENPTMTDIDHVTTLVTGLLSMIDKKTAVELINSFPEKEMIVASLN